MSQFSEMLSAKFQLTTREIMQLSLIEAFPAQGREAHSPELAEIREGMREEGRTVKFEPTYVADETTIEAMDTLHADFQDFFAVHGDAAALLIEARELQRQGEISNWPVLWLGAFCDHYDTLETLDAEEASQEAWEAAEEERHQRHERRNNQIL